MIVKRCNFLGFPLDLLEMKDIIQAIRIAMHEKRHLYLVTMNVAMLVAMRDDDKFSRYILDGDLITADGMGIVWGARLLGIPVPERIAGIDIMYETLAICALGGYRPYFFGATRGVLDAALNEARRKWPNLLIAGARHGYFGHEEEKAIAEDIRCSKADCLFIGISSPIKERFCHRWNSALDIPFIMGVGGAFDILAGKISRAPLAVQKCGAEWAFRLYQEPRRMWRRYFFTNTNFALTMLRGMILGDEVSVEERDILGM